ncbi:major histocompatibility complex class I LFA isoform X1 [Danio rerio]|uniref:Major histocompatibility complex class I LFA isoform X1 n=1 Tax=Danio rerio TaxID=7955 RepID=A0AC58IU49_DANRE
MDKILLLFLFLLPTSAPKGSHSLCLLATYIKGPSPFPELSGVMMLDDIPLLYYNGDTKTFFMRGNTTAEDNVFDANAFLSIIGHIQSSFVDRWGLASRDLNKTDRIFTLQQLVLCELSEDGEHGKMISRDAVEGTTTDELQHVDHKFTYKHTLNVSAYLIDFYLELTKSLHKTLFQPTCFKTLSGYLIQRRNQINRKVKPKVRLFKKELSSGFIVSCLATGFYPRHINLTLLRDGQPVSDHDVTGGDLLPNGDGTYQMRKSLEIRAEERQKHKYSCSVKHLSLDNKLHVDLDFDHGEPFKLLIPTVLVVLTICSTFIKERGRKVCDEVDSYVRPGATWNGEWLQESCGAMTRVFMHVAKGAFLDKLYDVSF